MENNLNTVVITGASRGIGKAIATIYASNGYTLFLCARNKVTLHKTVDALRLQFPNIQIHAYPCDLAIKEEAIDFANWILQQCIPSILINNTGTYIPGSVLDEKDDVLQSQLNTNLFSAYYVTRIIAPAMITKKSGHIVNIASIAGMQAYAGGGSYSISKHAMIGFSRNLRLELMPYQIKVTTVLPGAVLTDSWGDFDNSQHRIMEADDIARFIYNATQLSPAACVEDIVIRPVLGDL